MSVAGAGAMAGAAYCTFAARACEGADRCPNLLLKAGDVCLLDTPAQRAQCVSQLAAQETRRRMQPPNPASENGATISAVIATVCTHRVPSDLVGHTMIYRSCKETRSIGWAVVPGRLQRYGRCPARPACAASATAGPLQRRGPPQPPPRGRPARPRGPRRGPR